MRVVAILATLTGCLGTPSLEAPSDAAPPSTPREHFVTRAWPALDTCVGCHGSRPTIDFLAKGTADTAYDTVLAFQPPVVDLSAPSASLLLTMGQHTGPALDPADAEAVFAWLEAERDARTDDGRDPIVIGPVQPGAGISLALGTTGGRITFDAMPFPGGLYVTNTQITAGAAGLSVRHPLFVSNPVDVEPVIDTLDRFADVDLALDPNASERLADALFLGFAYADPLTIHFQALEAP